MDNKDQPATKNLGSFGLEGKNISIKGWGERTQDITLRLTKFQKLRFL